MCELVQTEQSIHFYERLCNVARNSRACLYPQGQTRLCWGVILVHELFSHRARCCMVLRFRRICNAGRLLKSDADRSLIGERHHHAPCVRQMNARVPPSNASKRNEHWSHDPEHHHLESPSSSISFGYGNSTIRTRCSASDSRGFACVSSTSK